MTKIVVHNHIPKRSAKDASSYWDQYPISYLKQELADFERDFREDRDDKRYLRGQIAQIKQAIENKRRSNNTRGVEDAARPNYGVRDHVKTPDGAAARDKKRVFHNRSEWMINAEEAGYEIFSSGADWYAYKRNGQKKGWFNDDDVRGELVW